VPRKDKKDGSSEKGQKGAAIVVSNFEYTPTLREVFGGIPAESTCPPGDAYITKSWSTVTIKKRKIQVLDRLIGAVSKVKKIIDRNTIQSIFSFAS
jgi:hypothetical protein